MKNNDKGFTLIELMIAILLGLIIVGVTITIYLITISSSSDTVKAAKLNNDIDAVMFLMINDLRRSGYWGGAIPGSDPKNNPFTQIPSLNQGQTNIHIPSTDCILYTYDYDSSTLVDLDEYFGFKLENNEIKFRTRINDASTYSSCIGSACCSLGDWESLTYDGSTTVTGLEIFNSNSKCQNVTQNQACAVGVSPGDTIAEVREIDISITAQVTNDSSTEKSQIGTVKVRNDRIYTQP